MLVRVLSVLAGMWLFTSAFMWEHTPAQFHGTWLPGLMVVVITLLSIAAYPRLRILNAVIGAWLFVSAFALPGFDYATKVNHVIVAVLLVVLALSPVGARPLGARRVVTP